MARGFDLSIKLSISDNAVAEAALKAAKNPSYCHTLLLKNLIEYGEMTAQELVNWLNENLGLMSGEQAEQWKKYSAGCHMAYFINRFRGAVQGTKADGTVVVGVARKPKAKEAAVEVKEEVEAPVEAEAVVTE
jgi:hypothetical protein